MPFEKGRNKTGGRAPGTPNKVTSERKARLNEILTQIEDKHLAADIDKLSPRDRVRLYADLLEYSIPKLTRAERPPTDLETFYLMSPEEKKMEIERLRNLKDD
ncbi:MAG: hypothetical protein AAF944_04680 [Bacteroidota bacterium]